MPADLHSVISACALPSSEVYPSTPEVSARNQPGGHELLSTPVGQGKTQGRRPSMERGSSASSTFSIKSNDQKSIKSNDQKSNDQQSVDPPSNSVKHMPSGASGIDTMSRLHRRPSVTSVCSATVDDAVETADLLRKRREKRRSGDVRYVSEATEESKASRSNLIVKEMFAHSAIEIVDPSIKDMLDGMRQLLLDTSNSFGAKVDMAVSNLDACFASHLADLARILNNSLPHGSVSHPSFRTEIQHTAERMETGPPLTETIGVTRGKARFAAPPTPRAFTPRRLTPLGNRAEHYDDDPDDDDDDDHEQTFSPRSSGGKYSQESWKTTSTSVETDGILSRIAAKSHVNERSRIAQMVWLFLEDPRLVPAGQAYARMLMCIILASCIVNVVQTVESPPLDSLSEAVLDYTVDGLLSAEIILRFIVCPNPYSFFTQGLNLLDMFTGPLTLIARVLLPILFPDHADTDSTASVIMKAWLPLGQLLRLIRRFESSYLIYSAFKNASEALPMLLYVLLLLITTFASLLYAIEPRHNIGSLPQSLWFTVVTIGTVGYGDVTPETPEGKFVACLLVIVSALYMAIPLGIVGNVFAEVWDDRKKLMLMRLARQRLQSLGYTAKDLPALFVCADTDADGNLNMPEFIEMMKALQFDTTGERAAELFGMFDADGGGLIDDREFLETLYPGDADIIYGLNGSK